MIRVFGSRTPSVEAAAAADARYRRVAAWLGRNRRGLLAALLALSFGSHLFRLDSPPIPLFDEGLFYIPAAKAILAGLPDPNFEHPPLGKLAIAFGIALLGDTPWGWRIAAAVAGSVGVFFTYRLSSRVWRSAGAGLIAAGLLNVDFLWLAFSRLAMLDIFLAAPLVAALSFGIDFRDSRTKWALAGTGLSLGLAAAAKWSGAWVLPVLLCLVWRRRPGDGFFRQLAAPAGLAAASAVGYLGVWVAYGMRSGQGLAEMAQRHAQMLSYQAVAGGKPDSLASNLLAPARWLLDEPLVLTSSTDGSHWQLLMSNPLVFCAGIAGAIWLGVRVARKRRAEEAFLLASLLALYLPWFALPRIKYFYYLLPVLPLLAVAAGGALVRLLPPAGGTLTGQARHRLLLVAAHLALATAFWVGAFPAVTGMWIR